MTAPQPRKSIGAQVYYGVRLDGEHDAEKFLDDLAGDLSCLSVSVMLGLVTGHFALLTTAVAVPWLSHRSISYS